MLQMDRILLVLATLCCINHIGKSQLEFQSCYNARGEPTRCEPPQQSFSFERQPTASSTCGSPPNTFCVRSASLGQISSDCSATCDADDSANAHPPEHMTDFLQLDTWWQSENSLNPQNVVVIDIPLKTMVEINVLSFQFQSLIPSNFRILKSVDNGDTYTDFHYFATSCITEYSLPSDQILSLENETLILCQAVDIPPLPGQISFFPLLDRPSTNDSTPGLSESLYNFMTATNIRVVLEEHYVIPNLAPDDLGYYYAIRDLNVLGSCQCHGHASECRLDSGTGRYYCACRHNTTGTFCESCSDFYQDVPWQRSTGANEFECLACNCNGQSEECRFDPSVYEQTNRISGGVCLNCRNNRAGRQCERCDDFFYPVVESDTDFTCTACDCDLAGVTDNGNCAQVDSEVSAGDCNCKLNTQGRTCGSCLSGFFNLSSENELGCQDCECSSNGSMSEFCDPISGLCPCKPNLMGQRCDQCQSGFYLPDPSGMEGCQPCGCNLGGSMSFQCNQLTGDCPCRNGIQGRTCSEVRDNYFVHAIDFLRLEAEDAADIPDQVIVTDEQNRFFTGIGFYRVEDGSSVVDFGSLTLPIDGLYEVVIRYSLEGAMLWNSSTLTIVPSSDDIDGPIDCGGVPEVTQQMSFEYANYMMGVGLSLTRTFCLSAGRSYQFILSDFVSGRSDDSAVLNIDSLVLIPVGSSLFTDPAITRDYMDCVALFRSLASHPIDPFTCRQTIFTASALIYDGAALCNCDVVGTVMGTSCMEIGGQCDCLPGVRGRRCDQCTPGFYNLTRSGCTRCDCNPSGSLGQLCDEDNGDCMCMENVNGQTCSSCIPDYWGFDSVEGCTQCDCNTTGSISSQCDELTGICFCREGVTGESCDRCQQQTFGFSSSGCSMCNCDSTGSVGEDCDIITGQCSCLPATSARDCSQCSQGTFNLHSSNPDGCQPCFCSGLSNTCSSASGFYYAQLMTSFNGTDASILQGWRLIDSSGNMMEAAPYPNGAGIVLQVGSDAFLEAPAHFLTNRLSSYSQYVSIEVQPVSDGDNVEQRAEYGVILIGNGVVIGANLSRTESGFRVYLHESAGWVRTDAPTSTLTSRDFQLVLSSLTELMVSASYNTDVILTSISLDTAIHQSEITDISDTMEVGFVENCTCPDNYTEFSCESCSSGFTRSSSGRCELCQCNGLSADCDPETGDCFDCSGATTGPSCELCARGFYGDPVGGVNCQPCPCPLTTTPGQFTQECVLSDSGNVTCLNCPPGHIGQQCESCIGGYFGDPTGLVGAPTSCSDCQCSGNIDTSDPSSCNRVTGVCERCLNNTSGAQCERCQDGFYGDAVTAKNCLACECDPEGSVSSTCDIITGQCPCIGNATGQRCDQCLPGFYGLGTPSGCVSCDCASPGSASEQCDEQGVCDCLTGVSGAKCDRCLPGFFGLSSSGCRACSCSAINSDSALCDMTDGACICRPGSTGDNCNQCQQNFFFEENTGCTACPKCYQDLEDVYMASLVDLDTRENDIQNLDLETSNLSPFDERILQTQNNISDLQNEATALVVRQTELLVIYDDVLFAINDTLRNRVTQINESLDSLKRVFTTVYITTFTALELMESLVMEFQTALRLVMRIESVDLPVIMNRSETIQSDSMNVSSTAQELEYILGNNSAQIEDLRNATYKILSVSASILSDADILMALQDEIRSDVDRIASTYGNLDLEFGEIDSNLTGYEVDLIILANRLRMKRSSLVEVPERDEILYLTANATEMEAFVRSDILNEIINQSNLFSTLNETYTAQRAEFEELFQEVSNLGMNVSTLLELIQSAHEEALALQENAQDLINEAEIVAENLESFDNDTFRIGRKVAEAMSDIDSINRNASTALSEAQRLEEALRNSSDSIRSAKEVANDALEIANTSFQAISSVDTESIVTSTNASLQSGTASKEAIDTLANDVADILTDLETLERDIADREAQVNSSEATNEQSAMDRSRVVTAVDQLRDELDSLDYVESSDLQEIRQLIDEVRDEYDSAGLSGVYTALRSRLEEQRENRERLEMELQGLMSNIEHLRRVNQALPTIPPGCNRGN